MKMKKNGDRRNQNIKSNTKEKKRMFTVKSMRINNAGLVGNMVT